MSDSTHKADSTWQASYDRLARAFEAHWADPTLQGGPIAIPPSLCGWLSTQCEDRFRLTPEQHDALEALRGFEWHSPLYNSSAPLDTVACLPMLQGWYASEYSYKPKKRTVVAGYYIGRWYDEAKKLQKENKLHPAIVAAFAEMGYGA